MQNYRMLRIPLGPGHIGIKHTPGPDYVSGEVNLQRPNPPGFLLPKGLHISVHYVHVCISLSACVHLNTYMRRNRQCANTVYIGTCAQ